MIRWTIGRVTSIDGVVGGVGLAAAGNGGGVGDAGRCVRSHRHCDDDGTEKLIPPSGVAAGAGECGEHAGPAAAGERGSGQARWQRVGHRGPRRRRAAGADVGDREAVLHAPILVGTKLPVWVLSRSDRWTG